MTDLTFLDCRGVSVLINAHERAVHRGRTMVLRHPQGIVARVLALPGVGEVLAIERSVLTTSG